MMNSPVCETGVRKNRGTIKKVLLTGFALGLVVIIFTGCGSPFPDPTKTGEFDRVVLLEEGTGTWCVNCPEVAENIEELRGEIPDNFIVLALHSQDIDPYATDETEARLSVLGVEVFPTLVYDGSESYRGVQTVDEIKQVIVDRRALGSPLKINLNASLTSDTIHYEIEVIVSDSLAEQINGILRIALVEDSLTHNQDLGVLHHIVRRLPEYSGADELTLNPGDTLSLTRELVVEGSWGPLTAVAWIEDTDHQVYQAAADEAHADEPDKGDFSIEMETDTIMTVSGIGQSAEYSFLMENHTSSDIILTVEVPEATNQLPENWFWQICVGEMCLAPEVPAVDTVDANGASDIHFTIGSMTDGSQGELIVEVSGGGEEVDRQRLIMLVE